MPEITLGQVEDYARGYFSENEVSDRITDKGYAFEVNHQSRAFLDTGDFMSMQVGGAPLLIIKQTGQVFSFDSDPSFAPLYDALSLEEFQAALADLDKVASPLDQLPLS